MPTALKRSVTSLRETKQRHAGTRHATALCIPHDGHLVALATQIAVEKVHPIEVENEAAQTSFVEAARHVRLKVPAVVLQINIPIEGQGRCESARVGRAASEKQKGGRVTM